MGKSRIRYANMGPWPYYVGFTCEAEAFDREMRRLKVDEAGTAIANSHSNATTHFLRNHAANMAIICIERPGKVSKEQYASLVAHEAVHVLQDMQRQLGELGSEAEAYIVQHIVQHALQIAWKTGRVARTEPVP